MATAAVVRLERVMELEQRQNWRNRAVVGGLQAMASRWAADARAEGLDGRIVERVRLLMSTYGQESPGDRPAVIDAIRQVLAGEPEETTSLANQSPLVAPVPTVQVQPPPPKSPAPAPSSEERAPKPKPVSRPATPSSQPIARSAPSTTGAAPTSLPDSSQSAYGEAHAGMGNLPEPGLGSTYVYDYVEAQADAPAGTPGRPDQSAIRPVGRPVRTAAELRSNPRILQGVGPAVAELLARLDIKTVEDVLWHLPLKHDDYRTMLKISDLVPGQQATVIANLWKVQERKVGMNRQMVQGILSDGTGTLTATWWSKWVVRQLQEGTTLRLSGKVGLFMGKKTLENPIFEDADQEALAAGRLAPVYRLTEGLSQKKMRLISRQVVDDFAHLVTDPLPRALLERFQLPDLASALRQIHFPEDRAEESAATRRLAFEELLYVQLGVLQRRKELTSATARPLRSDAETMARFVEGLPFPLTGAQNRVLREATADMARTVPMTRLVQGDVGSGKTAVAAGAMWITTQNNAQSVLLAPTQILAEQHYRGISRLLDPLSKSNGAPVEVALLTGRVTGAERERVLSGLRDGSIDVVVGTTALIQESVEFANLDLVVVDEQHRFGVEQRGALRNRSDLQPHLLVMSATPIPRTLALTVYGDLDVSTLDEMPPGRLPVKTVLFRPNERERVYAFVRKEASEGRQAFLVYPLVEESDVLDVGAATEAYERLQKEVFPDLRVALLHGQMRGSEKDEVMSAFAAGEFDVLVSTSVIEVGIDVPNASVIVIEDAERFGLAQLHQFRGRVGRGEHRSFCVLVSRAQGDSGEERLRVLESTTDGFVLAEKDLQMRGPGDFLGTRQSGLPELRIAALSDVDTLLLAREGAQILFEEDPTLAAYPALVEQVARFWRGEGDVS